MEARSSISTKPQGGARAWLSWGLAVCFVIYYFSFQTGYAIVNPSVQKDLGLSVAQVGMIAAVYTWVFALCQFMSGPLLDRLGARKVLLPAILIVTVGIFVFANAGRFETLLLSQILIAIGACTGFVGAGYVGGSWFGMAKFSFMFGLVQFAASLFSAFNQNLLNWAVVVFPWHELFNISGMLGVALLAASVFFLRDPQPRDAAKGQDLRGFIGSVGNSLVQVGRVPHVWMAAAFGSLCFGVMLGLGVVWGPKLLVVRGYDASTANAAASFLWLGLAAGCFIAPWSSDYLGRRKLPVLIGIAIQIVTLSLLLYAKPFGASGDILLCFLFGFGNSAHMLAFSTAGDVVEPKDIGTSAAVVNGIMFILGGIMISRPGIRIGLGLDAGITPGSIEIAQYAGRPFIISVCIAFVVAALMRETYGGASQKPTA